MSNAYDPGFFFPDPKGGGALSHDQLLARRRIALALATRARGYPKNIGEGIASIGEALGERRLDAELAAEEAKYRAESQKAVDRNPFPTAAPGAPATPPVPPTVAPTTAPAAAAPNLGPLADDIDPFSTGDAPTPPPQPVPAQPTVPRIQGQQPTRMALMPQEQQPTQALPQPPGVMPLEEVKARVARNETGTRPDAYTARGQRSRRGDYPYGKYQVMGENIPAWTKTHLGKEMTIDEFLSDPDAQERVADGQLGMYLNKYGPNGAAAAWFAGEKGMNDPNRKDTLGTAVSVYVDRFKKPITTRNDIVASLASQSQPEPLATATEEESAVPAGMGLFGAQQVAQKIAQAPPVAQAPPIGRPVPTLSVEQAQARPQAQQPQQPQARKEPELQPPGEEEARVLRDLGRFGSDENIRRQLQPVAEYYRQKREKAWQTAHEAWQKEQAELIKQRDPKYQQDLLTSQQNLENAKLQTSGILGEKHQEAIQAIPGHLERARRIQETIDKGVFSGLTGQGQLLWEKGASALGFPRDPRVVNTERLKADLAAMAGSQRLAVAGPGAPSNKDMELLQDAAAGRITLEGDTIREVSRVLEKLQLSNARYHQQKLEQFAKENPEMADKVYARYGLPMEEIASKPHVERLLKDVATDPKAIEEFNQYYHTPGLAERIIASRRPR
jgi:hypothetical protein